MNIVNERKNAADAVWNDQPNVVAAGTAEREAEWMGIEVVLIKDNVTSRALHSSGGNLILDSCRITQIPATDINGLIQAVEQLN